MDVLLHHALGNAEALGDFLVEQIGGKLQAFDLTRRQPFGHETSPKCVNQPTQWQELSGEQGGGFRGSDHRPLVPLT